MPRPLRQLRQLRHHSRSVADIEKEKSSTWVEVPQPSKDVLRNRMVQMYWVGLSREVRLLVDTLRLWQKEQYAEVRGEDEVLQAENMQGFRAFVERAVGERRSENEQNAIRRTIRETERNARVLSVDQRRAQMLLQGAGFLDISKLMEYRKPEEDYGLWTRPRAAQLMLERYDPTSHMPEFRPSMCAHCSSTIRGIQFRCLNRSCQPNQRLDTNELLVFCETCKRVGEHEGHLRKLEKRCILREVVTPTRSRQICTCENNQPSGIEEGDGDGENLYFAVDGGHIHRRRCPVLKLKRRHEQAKLDELRHSRQSVRSPEDRQGGERRGASTHASTRSVGWAAQSIPPPIEFGNVHMILMAGTIIIENGALDSKGGARISIRDPPQFAMVTSTRQKADHLMAVSHDRRIYQKFNVQKNRRIKACMKQVVGGIFTGLSDSDDSCELDIIDALVEGSRRCAFDPMETQAYHDRRLTDAVEQIVSKLRVLIGDRVTRYFDVIASKLFTVELTHNMITNHCQRFCANILDFRAFGSFLATTPACRLHVPRNPLYLVSFVCPPGSYDSPRRIRPETKNQVPNGLTEEYLLRFRRYGHHEESDHIDTLLEYWNDWGAFGGTLYKYQDLFPWDCTEAYRRGEAESGMKCNNCSIAKHVWSFPFDAWSIVQLHIHRDKSMYSPSHGSDNKTLTDAEWMCNRLNVLSALKALTAVTVAMAKTTSFRATCRWNRERRALTPDTASRLDRVKLSGIYRAQPHSHSFEQSKYHDCTLAAWALLSREDQIREYERLRDYRAEELTEIPPRPQSRRNRSRLPRDMRGGRTTRSDINGENRHHHRHHHEQNHDSGINEPSDFEDFDNEDFVAEAGFEDGGGLIPDGFGADPGDEEYYEVEAGGGLIPDGFGPDPRGDEEHYEAEVGAGLIPDTYGPDPDIHYHAPGTGPCDYDNDNNWVNDIQDRIFENCQPTSTSDSRGIYQSTSRSEMYERNERSPTWPDVDSTSPTRESGTDRNIIKRILDEVVTERIPPSMLNPTSINTDNYNSSSILNSYNDYLSRNNNGDLDGLASDFMGYRRNNDYSWRDLFSNSNDNDYSYGGGLFDNSYNNNDNYSSWGWGGGGGDSGYGNNNNNNNDDGCSLM